MGSSERLQCGRGDGILPQTKRLVFSKCTLPMASIVALGSIGGPALAQDDSAQEDGAIIITARKKEETLQEAPVAISLVTPAQIENTGALTVSDLTKRLPNVAASYPDADPLQSNTTIRGFVTDARNIGFDSGFGIFIDGGYAGRMATANKVLPDVERVEFLPGPQATLFGKNTTLGVMNIVPKKPGDELEVNAAASAGNMGLFEARASARGPLTDVFGVGLTLGTRHHDGFIRNLFDDSVGPDFSSYGGAFQLTARTTNFDAHLMVDYTDQKWDNAYFSTRIEGFDPLPIDTVDTDFPNIAKGEEIGVTLTWNWDVGPGTLTSISALRNFDTERSYDDDYYNFPVIHLEFFDESQDHFSQELRYAGTAGALDYLFGGYYQTQKIESVRSADVFGLTPDLRVLGQIKGESFAIFGNGDYSLTDRLNLELGGRWSHETKKLPVYSQIGAAPVGLLEFTIDDLVANGLIDPDGRKVDDFSYTAALAYELTDNLNVHFRYSKGFKSGGYNIDYVTFSELTPLEFEDESVDHFEAGIKSQFFDGALIANIALFYSKFHDLQVSQFQTIEGIEVPFISISNAGEARTRGGELNLGWDDGGPLTVNSALGYTDAIITDFPTPFAPGGNWAGTRLEGPEWTFNILGTYEVTLGRRSLDLIAEYSYQSPSGRSIGERPVDISDDLNVVNLRARFNLSQALSIAGWVENVTNSRAVTSRGNQASAQEFLVPVLGPDIRTQVIGTRLPPRQWGVTLRYTY